MKVNKVSQISPDYPRLLRTIPSPPKQLYVLGNLAPLAQTKSVAIVGSRAMTPYGRQATSRLASELASRGVAIVSGLALGVDACAHQACLDNGGYTIAVLPCGLDAIHPASNRALAIRILRAGGALVSEYPNGTKPFKQNFIARNRIVSGLTDGLLITEASERSGSLHTANFALDQGRTVMAVPGNITTNTSAGSNNLIKTGAATITHVNDALIALGLEPGTRAVDVVGATAEEDNLIQLLKQGITDINQLQANSKLHLTDFNQTMTMLEITGKIHPLGAGHWTIS